MASPKVFISSTCYDLLQIRDNLFEFIKSIYFEPVLSEKGDIFFHPDLHTHESCINEVENCQLFVLIIGGRFGGNYKSDIEKSITNAEYEAAKLKNIPVFTFIKREVYEDHRVYQQNKKDEALIKRIKFPSIEKQDQAIRIFDFIDRVRLADVNNGVFSFEYVNQIKDNLGKQWAGLMFNFLNERLRYKDTRIVSQTLDNLALINKKTEELVENIYKQLNPQEAEKNIEIADKILKASQFYNRVLNLFSLGSFSSSLESIAKIDPKKQTWYEYLSSTGEFELIPHSETTFEDEEEDREVELWIKTVDSPVYWSAKIKKGESHPKIKAIIPLYENLKQLNKTERKKALEITISNTGFG